MNVSKFIVIHVPINFIKSFVEQFHYSHSINGVICDHCFALFDEDQNLIGAAIFGKMAMANQWKRFGDKVEDVIELRRLCCIDDTPKNTESFFIGKCLKWLTEYTKFKVVASYSDLEYGHEGTIYKASNFECLGIQAGARVILYNGKRYHDKAIRTKYNGKLKPFAENLIKALESGEAVYVETKGKVAYQYILKRKKTKADYENVEVVDNSLSNFFI